MKLTKEEKRIFVEKHDKYLKEAGWLARLFAKGVSKRLQKDKDVQSAIEDTEDSMSKARQRIEKNLGGDKEKIKKYVTPDMRKALGYDF